MNVPEYIKETINKQQAEIDSLKAHVDRLKTVVSAAINGLEANEMHGGVEHVRDYLKGAWNETPQQSLSAHDAALMAEFHVNVGTLKASNGTTYIVSINHPNRSEESSLFDSDGRLELYEFADKEHAEQTASDIRDFFNFTKAKEIAG